MCKENKCLYLFEVLEEVDMKENLLKAFSKIN